MNRVALHVLWGNLDPEHEQFAVHPPIAPTGVLVRQAQHQGADRVQGARPTTPARMGARRTATSDEVAVPFEDGVGAHH